MPEVNKDTNIIYPTLITAKWCPYTLPAISLWKEATSSVGLALRVSYAGLEDGDKIVTAKHVAGVPCLIANQKTLHYGLNINLSEAVSFLKKSVA